MPFIERLERKPSFEEAVKEAAQKVVAGESDIDEQIRVLGRYYNFEEDHIRTELRAVVIILKYQDKQEGLD